MNNSDYSQLALIVSEFQVAIDLHATQNIFKVTSLVYSLILHILVRLIHLSRLGLTTCGSGPLLRMAGYSSPQVGYKLIV